VRTVIALLALLAIARADDWQTIRGCRLIENESNDGDSFHVKADGEERIFRLYFVDTPEAESGGYVEARVGEQAKELGLTEEESVEMGKKATAFTRAVLSRPFKVTTRGQTLWEQVRPNANTLLSKQRMARTWARCLFLAVWHVRSAKRHRGRRGVPRRFAPNTTGLRPERGEKVSGLGEERLVLGLLNCQAISKSEAVRNRIVVQVQLDLFHRQPRARLTMKRSMQTS
jgi:hypothetical protein